MSAKLERLKRGLVADTIPLVVRQYPSLKNSQINYSQKSGRFGAFDPLRKRSKLFRKAVTKFAPPYHFWHKEFINSMKLKPLVEGDPFTSETPEQLNKEFVCCVWCQQSVGRSEYEFHKTNRCQRRHEFLGNGYYQCSSCKEAFLDELKAKRHVSLHFPNLQVINPEGGQPGQGGASQKPHKNLSIICRDQAKRKKWL